MFVWGFGTFMDMNVAPGNSINIYVTGQRWSWTFEYPSGVTSSNELVVPMNQPVKLTMSSKDLVHSLFIPQFRIKQDVFPNRYSTVWFQATALGTYDLFCTEYCGTGHSDMTGKVRVLSPEEYQKWIETGGIDPSKMTLAQYGEALYRAKACVTCHTVDGSQRIGPSFKGVFGHRVQLSDSSSVMADENYIRESMMNPGAKIVLGFGNIMPSYQGMLKDKEVNAIIEYLKTLGGETKPMATSEPAKAR
jgi:cytochrome c oxidase subunit 2